MSQIVLDTDQQPIASTIVPMIDGGSEGVTVHVCVEPA
jgi:hypothetical protein